MLKVNVKDYFNQLIHIMECISGGNIVYHYDFSEPMLSGPEEDCAYVTICQLYTEVDDEYEEERTLILLSMELELSKREVDEWTGSIRDSYMCECDEILYCLEDMIWNSPLYFILGRFLQQYEDFGKEKMDENDYVDYTDAVLKTYSEYSNIECLNGYDGGYSLKIN